MITHTHAHTKLMTTVTLSAQQYHNYRYTHHNNYLPTPAQCDSCQTHNNYNIIVKHTIRAVPLM